MVLLELPISTSLEFLDEGGANVVYRYSLPPPSPNISADLDGDDDGSDPNHISPTDIPAIHYDPVFEGRLLRLGKALPSRVSNEQSYRYFRDVLSIKFSPEHLVAQDLVKLPVNIVRKYNMQLRVDEEHGRRLKKRCGLYLANDDPHGILMMDMTPNAEKGEILIEFKPKWLVQSPSAPISSRRCRTCALQAQRNADHRAKKEKEEKSFCPLDLVSNDRTRVARAMNIIMISCNNQTQAMSPLRLKKLQRRLVTYFIQNPLLGRLQQLQQYLDKDGVLRTDLKSMDFLTAMTIRDCTLYLKIPPTDASPIDARIGDLDLKSPAEGKAEYWRSLERSLIDGGWYTGTENDTYQKQGDTVWCTD
ncbi:MAG: Inositol-pentakisphosphate 2-kinase [Pycnora praestabilis]|nr:MAG: Inositol-pentakisphosphate 2-kinase [Pycnora praestabilis]